MVRRPRNVNTLERWEIALVKTMVEVGQYNDQEILAYFTRPTRSINHRVISEIRTGAKHRQVRAASMDQLSDFLALWPDLDDQTGLSNIGDELVVKAREAMIAAVHTFNGAGITFRTELFIVTAVIAWTYVLHAWYKKEGINYRYLNRDGTVKKTKHGEDCYWELQHCLNHVRSPVAASVKNNLEFLLELRHEIEHRSTNRIDDAVGAKLQACCLNFNNFIKQEFGNRTALEKRLPLALQFVTFDTEQRALLKRANVLPGHIAAMMNEFDGALTVEERADPAFAYRVVFVPKTAARASSADTAIEFVRPGSDEEVEINRVLIKDVDKRRYTATDICNLMHEEGFPRFTMHSHTALARELNAKTQGSGFGRVGDYRNTWVWFDTWVARVKAHCQEHAERYR